MAPMRARPAPGPTETEARILESALTALRASRPAQARHARRVQRRRRVARHGLSLLLDQGGAARRARALRAVPLRARVRACDRARPARRSACERDHRVRVRLLRRAPGREAAARYRTVVRPRVRARASRRPSRRARRLAAPRTSRARCSSAGASSRSSSSRTCSSGCCCRCSSSRAKTRQACATRSARWSRCSTAKRADRRPLTHDTATVTLVQATARRCP